MLFRSHGAISSDGHWLATTDDAGDLRIWPVPASGAEELQPVTAMRVDGALFECAWAPGTLDLHAAGQRGEYAFTFRPPRVMPQSAASQPAASSQAGSAPAGSSQPGSTPVGSSQPAAPAGSSPPGFSPATVPGRRKRIFRSR